METKYRKLLLLLLTCLIAFTSFIELSAQELTKLRAETFDFIELDSNGQSLGWSGEKENSSLIVVSWADSRLTIYGAIEVVYQLYGAKESNENAERFLTKIKGIAPNGDKADIELQRYKEFNLATVFIQHNLFGALYKCRTVD